MPVRICPKFCNRQNLTSNFHFEIMSAADAGKDLRLLTVAELKQICTSHGVPTEGHSRWELVNLARALLSSEQDHKSPSPVGSRGSSPVPRLMDAVQEPPGNRVSPSLSTIRTSARKARQRKQSPDFFLSKTLIFVLAFIFAALVLAQFV